MKKEKNSVAHSEHSQAVYGLAAFSVLIYWLDRLTEWVYGALVDGFFGKFFTSYSSMQEAFENSFLKNHFISSKFKRYFRKVCEFFSKLFESSYCLNGIKSVASGMLSIPLKAYGVSLFFFGLYTVLICLIRWLVPGMTEVGLSYVWIGILCCVISVPIMVSTGSVAEALGAGIVPSMLAKDFFGFRDESFDKKENPGRWKSNLLLGFGMLLGLLTMFVHPALILMCVGGIVVAAFVFSSPEVGVLLAILLLPFVSLMENPTLIMSGWVALIVVSYGIKLISGKRILRLELMDLAVALFLILLYLSGLISAGGTAGYYEVLISCVLMAGYFLTVNLIRTELWLNRCVLSLRVSVTIVAVMGILQYLFAMPQLNAWLDTEYFYDIEGRVSVLFDNPNVLASYLILALPFTLLGIVRSKGNRERLLSLISCASVLICLVLTWSRGAWLAALAALLIFTLVYSKKTVRWLVFLLGCVPLLSFLIPRAIVRRFSSIGDLSDSSSMYRLYTWKSALRGIGEHLMGGVGYGNAAYNEMYPQFAYAGIEAAEHTHSLYLQILFGMGVGGLLIFGAVILLFAQMNLEYLKKSKDSDSRWLVLACVCSIAGSLIMGAFDFLWYNYRIFFLFWVVLALGCACVRVGLADQRRYEARTFFESDHATLDVEI